MRGLRALSGAALVAALIGVLSAVALVVPSPHVTHPSTAVVRPVAVRTPGALPSVPALVAWTGPVEELFFHPLVRRPELAFTPDKLGRGFADYFVTAREFRGILDGLWRNGWTLVDVHRAAAGTVRLPVGRKPFVLSEDDVNYYDYFRGRGLASRLALDGGRVRADFAGQLSDDDLVPLVDAEVAAHPEFSADGAKGVLALTGYQGLFGEHDLNDPAARERVRTLVAALRATGWTMASHTFGHITLSKDSVRVIQRDTGLWLAMAGDLLGGVDVLVYPFGARPSLAGVAVLRDAGFTIQLDIDVLATHALVEGVIRMSRRHIDGYAFDQPRRLSPFFDVADVRDPLRP